MENNTRKYILIPEYKPLWAMRRCFGPTHGPLKEPCPTALDIIGELLRQTGKEALTIFEVPNPSERKGDPVRLTLDNYTLPYDEIVKGVKATGMKINQVRAPQEPKRPEAVESDKSTAKAIADLINSNETANPAEIITGATVAAPAPVPPVEEPEKNQAPAEETTVTTADVGEPDTGEAQDTGDESAREEDVPTEGPVLEGNGEAAPPAEEEIVEGDTDEGEGGEADGETQPAQGGTHHMTRSERRAARKAAEAAAQKNNQ